MRHIGLLLLLFLLGCTESDEQTPLPTPTPDAGEEDTSSPPDDAGPGVVVETVVIEPDMPVISLGERLALTATPLDPQGMPIETGAGIARWESSDPAVAPVSSGGELIGASIGTTTVTATFLDTSASVEVAVVEVAVERVDVLPKRVVFTIGDTFDFLAVPFDSAGERIDMGLPVVWEVVDTSVATVEGSTVTAVGAGTTELVAEIAGVEGRAELVVEDAVLTGVAIDQLGPTLVPTDTASFSVSYQWQDAPPDNLPTPAWSLDDTGVATVDVDGAVTAVAPGTAVLTATVGGFSDTVQIEVVGDFGEVATGADHACGRLRGAVFCFGDDTLGQLGHDAGDFGRTAIPGEVVAVASGRAHTCALTSADELYCWGANDLGQLGLGDTTARDVPARVPGTFSGRLYAARNVTCAGGQCWGELPSGVTTSPVATPGALHVGDGHSCTLSGGTTTCSGSNSDGQIGVNSTDPTASGSPVGGFTFVALSLGDRFTCAIVTGGGLACWGDGDLGQIGDGNFTDALVPILTPLQTMAGNLAVGATHVCLRDAPGDVLCWGGNALGQVGDGTTAPVGSPVDVSGALTFVAVDAEAAQTCGVTDTGALYCWGNGVTAPTAVPVPW